MTERAAFEPDHLRMLLFGGSVEGTAHAGLAKRMQERIAQLEAEWNVDEAQRLGDYLTTWLVTGAEAAPDPETIRHLVAQANGRAGRHLHRPHVTYGERQAIHDLAITYLIWLARTCRHEGARGRECPDCGAIRP